MGGDIINSKGGSKRMKSKLLVYFFRSTVILACALGIVYVAKFFLLSTEIATVDTEDAYKSLGTWSMMYFLYLIVSCIAAVLSVAAFKTTGKVCSAVRTAVLLFAAVVNLMAYKYVSIFASIEDSIEALDEFQDIEDNGFTFVMLTFVGAFLLIFTAITSIVAIVKKSGE